MTYDTLSYPYNCVVLIESIDPADGNIYLQGSGVIIGPHTILTASHVVYDVSAQLADQNLLLYPGWSGPDPKLGPGYINNAYTDHYFTIGQYGSDGLYPYQSAQDYAVIDTSYTFSSWLGVSTNYGGGTVHLTGYPAYAGGSQIDQTGTVSADPNYSVLDYGTISSSPGNSGGPLWFNDGSGYHVVGLASTVTQGCQITPSDLSQIESWVKQDGYSLTHVAPTVTAVSSISLAEGQFIAASSLIYSISNPSGDSITQYIYMDEGGGSGYFTVDGARQADGAWIYPTGSSDVQYVGGASPGVDSLEVGIYDSSTNSYAYSSLFSATTTRPHPARVADDFNGDGMSDILWRNTSTGATETWFTKPSAGYSYASDGAPSLDWQIAATGDFNGDSNADILWRNTQSDDTYLYLSNSSNGFTFEDLGTVGGGWKVAGTGYFTNSGLADILWQNSNGAAELWETNPSGGFNYASLGSVPGWEVASIGDFNGDGFSDILWRNRSTGAVETWMTNASGGFTYANDGASSLDWQIAGTGNFGGASGGDGDILWRNTQTGDAYLYLSNGSSGFTYDDLGLVSTNWQIAEIGNFSNSGMSDILWRNTTTGDDELWLTKSGGGFSYSNVGNVPSNWTIAK